MSVSCYDSIQMIEPPETAELQAFVRTVEARSLSRAALELGAPRATVSRRLARLEERLGVRLLRRTTRSLAVTDAGEVLYRQAGPLLDALAAAAASVRRPDGEIRGELRVSLPPLSGSELTDVLTGFAQRYPAVRLRLHTSTAHVDLIRDGFDVALRATPQLEPGLIARQLGVTELIAVASPAYLAAHGTPRTARELGRHRLLAGFTRGVVPSTHWPLRSGGQLRIEPALSSNDLEHLAAHVRAGLGIAMVPEPVVRAEVARGALLAVLPRVLGVTARLSLVYAEREFMPPQVRAFIDVIVAWAATTTLLSPRGR